MSICVAKKQTKEEYLNYRQFHNTFLYARLETYLSRKLEYFSLDVEHAWHVVKAQSPTANGRVPMGGWVGCTPMYP